MMSCCLCSVSGVCSTWRMVVSMDSASRERKLRFLSQRAPLQKENCVPAKKAVVRHATAAEPLSAIHNVIHVSVSQPLTTSAANTFPVCFGVIDGCILSQMADNSVAVAAAVFDCLNATTSIDALPLRTSSNKYLG